MRLEAITWDMKAACRFVQMRNQIMGPLFVGISHKDVLFEGDEYTRDEAVNDINQLIQEKSTILLLLYGQQKRNTR